MGTPVYPISIESTAERLRKKMRSGKPLSPDETKTVKDSYIGDVNLPDGGFDEISAFAQSLPQTVLDPVEVTAPRPEKVDPAAQKQVKLPQAQSVGDEDIATRIRRDRSNRFADSFSDFMENEIMRIPQSTVYGGFEGFKKVKKALENANPALPLYLQSPDVTLGLGAGTVQAAMAAATPFSPELMAFTQASGMMEGTPAEAIFAPVTATMNPETEMDQDLAILGDAILPALIGLRKPVMEGIRNRKGPRMVQSVPDIPSVEFDNIVAGHESRIPAPPVKEVTPDVVKRRIDEVTPDMINAKVDELGGMVSPGKLTRSLGIDEVVKNEQGDSLYPGMDKVTRELMKREAAGELIYLPESDLYVKRSMIDQSAAPAAASGVQRERLFDDAGNVLDAEGKRLPMPAEAEGFWPRKLEELFDKKTNERMMSVALGSAMGVSRDEEGNLTFDPVMGLAGTAGAIGAVKIAPRLRKILTGHQLEILERVQKGELKSVEAVDAFKSAVRAYIQKGEGKDLPVAQKNILLQQMGKDGIVMALKKGSRNMDLQHDVLKTIIRKEQELGDLQAALSKEGWATEEMKMKVRDQIVTELETNAKYKDMPPTWKKYAIAQMEKVYDARIEQTRKNLYDREAGLSLDLPGITDKAGVPPKGIPPKGADRAPGGKMGIDNEGYQDIGNVAKNFRDVYRNFEVFFGDRYPLAKKLFLDPLDASKSAYTDYRIAKMEEMDATVVKKYGIEPDSKESAAVQEFGENTILAAEDLKKLGYEEPEYAVMQARLGDDVAKDVLNANAMKAFAEKLGQDGARAMIRKAGYEKLKTMFGEEKAKNIVYAERWFRKYYDETLEQVNNTWGKIYPNDPERVLPRRADYFRHYKELSDRFGGLWNILNSDFRIDPRLSGISDTTQPKRKWQSFAQRRLGMFTKKDAVGGFLEYLPNAAHAIYIDPNISRFRGLASVVGEMGAMGGAKDYVNMKFFLEQFANELSGKTLIGDQILTLGSRRAMRALGWTNNRAKANMVMMNAGSSVSQIYNVPQGVASAGAKYSALGLREAMADVMRADGSKLSDQSPFIKERITLHKTEERFDTGLLKRPRQFANWMMRVLDEAGTRFIWDAHYLKALDQGIENPIAWADGQTRKLIGGRGIGEMPLIHRTKVANLMMPFQYEVGNLWNVMGDWRRDGVLMKKVVTLAAMNWMFNRAGEWVRGSGVTLDPIRAAEDATGLYIMSLLNDPMNALQAAQVRLSEEDAIKKGVGRLAGELLSNIPLGATVAELFMDERDRKQFLGREDPTRFGSGAGLIPRILKNEGHDAVANALEGNWSEAGKATAKLASRVLLPFGGNQLDKTLRGMYAIKDGSVYDAGGKWQFFVDAPDDQVRALIFGPSGTQAAQKYYDRRDESNYDGSTRIPGPPLKRNINH